MSVGSGSYGASSVVYELTVGRDRFPNRYGDFASLFLGYFGGNSRPRASDSVLRKQWQRKATDYRRLVGTGSLRRRVTKLVELRRAEGYMAQCLSCRICRGWEVRSRWFGRSICVDGTRLRDF